MTLDGLSGECFADDCDECTSPLCCCECHDDPYDWWESE